MFHLVLSLDILAVSKWSHSCARVARTNPDAPETSKTMTYPLPGLTHRGKVHKISSHKHKDQSKCQELLNYMGINRI